MTPRQIEKIMDQIEATRARNNKYFMQAWRLLFRLSPKEAAKIQRAIRKGDMRISRLNGRLARL